LRSGNNELVRSNEQYNDTYECCAGTNGNGRLNTDDCDNRLILAIK
jgi:hypothetical protein